MFALFLLTFATASSVGAQNCATLNTPELCNGKPSTRGKDYVCAWNVRTLHPSCTEVEAEEFNLCAMYNGNAAACAKQPSCFYDPEDMECEVLEHVEHGEAPEAEDMHHIMPAPPMPPSQPSLPALPAQPIPSQPVQPAQPAAVQPSQPVPPPAQPTSPQIPATTPTTPVTPAQPTPVNPAPVAPAPVNPPPLPPTQPVPPIQPAPAQPASNVPRHCEALPQTQCFGPSYMTGELCMWDAEDFECSSVRRNDAEAICKQFAGDMQKCDAQLDCFWDAKDRECSEVEQGMPPHVVVGTNCATFTTETGCAGTASCFWDDVLCVNVVQAVNVCQVYTTPKLCSTNVLCQWKTTCVFAGSMHYRLGASHGASQMAPYAPVAAAPQAGYGQPAAVPQQQPGMVPQQPGVMPQQQPGMVPGQPAAPRPQTNPAYPAAPQTNPAYPAAPAAPQTNPAYPAAPGTAPQTNPAYPAAGAGAAPGAHAGGMGPMSPNSGYGRAQFCKMLSKQDCFGASIQPGELCMWDAEDFECNSYNELDAEGICKQWALNPDLCNAQMDCFWDAKDRECSDVKGIIPGRGYGMGPMVSRTNCNTYKTAETCAAQATCFWDQAGHTKNCVVATAGHWLQQVNVNSRKISHATKKGTEETKKKSSTPIAFFPSFIMVVLGFAVGVLATLKCKKSDKQNSDFQAPLGMDYVQQTDQAETYA